MPAGQLGGCSHLGLGKVQEGSRQGEGGCLGAEVGATEGLQRGMAGGKGGGGGGGMHGDRVCGLMLERLGAISRWIGGEQNQNWSPHLFQMFCKHVIFSNASRNAFPAFHLENRKMK